MKGKLMAEVAPVTEKEGSKPLLNLKQERYCQLLAKGKTVSQAYLEIFEGNPDTVRLRGYKLNQNKLVRARLEYLRSQETGKTVLTRNGWLYELELVGIDKDDKYGATAKLRAMELIGKAQKFFADGNTGNTTNVAIDARSFLQQLGKVPADGQSPEAKATNEPAKLP